MGDHIDDIATKLNQLSKLGGYKIDVRKRFDDFSNSEDASPIEVKSDRDAIPDNIDNELISNDAVKSIKKTLTNININVEEEKFKEIPISEPNMSPKKQKETPNDLSPSLNPKQGKDLSPSKFSNYGRSSKRGSRGTSKTIQEVRKIIEKWPKIEEAIEELKQSEKV